MRPSLLEVMASAVPFAVPLRMPFRGERRRVGYLIEGPEGWGEFSPFDDYAPVMAARWLGAALEAAYDGWPEPVRSSVPVNEIVPAVPADQVRGLLAGVVVIGATVKVKVTGDLADDEPRVAAVRDAVGPAGAIRLDVNGAWNWEQALHQLPVLAAAAGGLEYVEQPLASLSQMAGLRRATGVSLAVDESIRLATDPFDPGLAPAVREAADVVVLKVAPLGGVAAVLRLAELLRMPMVISGAMETSIGLAAGIAAAAALPVQPLACGLGTGRLLAADLVEAPLVPVGGRLAPMLAAPDPHALLAARSRVTADEQSRLRQRLVACWEYL